MAGFTGQEVTINTCGQVGNFHNVLHVPVSQASVRSVGAALDLRSGSITFTTEHAQYVDPRGKVTTIARRTNYGLYAVIPGAMPPPAPPVPVFISVPMQIRREGIHRLHKSLGHAGIERMRYVLKNFPKICGSLTTRDLALFTTCPACQVGKFRKKTPPKTTSTRSKLIGYRLHADTTGIIRPSTRGEFCRALDVVNDASRWVFIYLLRTNTMRELSQRLQDVLPTSGRRRTRTTHSCRTYRQ